MKFTRRKFIQSSAVAAVAAALGNAAGGGGALGRSSGKGPDSVSYLKREHFESFINTAFRIRNDEGRTALVRLCESVDLRNPVNQERGYAGESFRLGFDVSRKTDITQGIYHFDHENLGRFSLFLGSIGGSGIHFEAIINRIC